MFWRGCQAAQSVASARIGPLSALRSIGFMSCGFEEVVAFFVPEEVADVSDRLPELVIGSGGRLSDQGFYLIPAAFGLRWVARLSSITTSPLCRVGASWVST